MNAALSQAMPQPELRFVPSDEAVQGTPFERRCNDVPKRMIGSTSSHHSLHRFSLHSVSSDVTCDYSFSSSTCSFGDFEEEEPSKPANDNRPTRPTRRGSMLDTAPRIPGRRGSMTQEEAESPQAPLQPQPCKSKPAFRRETSMQRRLEGIRKSAFATPMA